MNRKPSVKVSVKPSVNGLEKVHARSEKVLAIPREFDSLVIVKADMSRPIPTLASKPKHVCVNGLHRQGTTTGTKTGTRFSTPFPRLALGKGGSLGANSHEGTSEQG
jgi:hypothetical protein